MLRETYDVVVVGAGPSGSSASRSAALEGAKTLLVEKKKEIGVPVKCGEFIPSLNEVRKLLPSASSIIGFYKMISQEIISNKTSRIRVYSPNNTMYEFGFDGLVLDREMFDKVLTLRAEVKGVTVQTSCSARAIMDKGEIKKILLDGPHGENIVKARFVIGADGFPSNVGKWIQLESRSRPENVVYCIQRKVENVELENDTVEIYFGNKYAPGGYAYIIPKGNKEANVGLGVRLTHLRSKKSIIQYINAFWRKHPIASRRFLEARPLSLIVKLVPAGGLVKRLYGNRTLLVGDAAGTVIPINGSGIPTALVSGHIAGEIASRYLRKSCELSTYATVLRREIGYLLKRGLMYRKVADLFMRWDALFEKTLQVMGTKNVGKVIKCEPIGSHI